MLSKLSVSQKVKLLMAGIISEADFIAMRIAAPQAMENWLGKLPEMPIMALGPEFDEWRNSVINWDFKRMIKSTIQPRIPLATLAKEHVTSKIRPVQDQQQRGTCVAFGTVAAFENAYLRAGKDIDFSEQFQYWSCKEDDGHPGNGSWVKVSFPAAMKRGICKEDLWKYVGHDTNDPGQGPPPEKAVECAAQHKPKKFTEINPNAVKMIKEHLTKDKVVTFSVPVFDSSMRNRETARTGQFMMPLPKEQYVGGHAMAFIGYRDNASRPGGGDFVLRNSWGTKWAPECKYGAGNGLIPYAYIEKFGMEAFTFDQV